MARKKDAPQSRPGSPVLRNKKARFNFHIDETLEAGISLLGSEVKSLRDGRASLDESFARLTDGQVFLVNMHIGPYEQAREQHDPHRPRRLLLHRREINRTLARALTRGCTLVPLKLYWKGGKAKVELAIARGKRQFDKREDIKKRDTQRDVSRELSHRSRKARRT
jgi:SsrA-binding protein